MEKGQPVEYSLSLGILTQNLAIPHLSEVKVTTLMSVKGKGINVDWRLALAEI